MLKFLENQRVNLQLILLHRRLKMFAEVLVSTIREFDEVQTS